MTALCPVVSSRLESSRPGAAVKDQVYAEYGIPAGQRYRYRIDHLVPVALDGGNSAGNLWPQLVRASYAKDRLEVILHSMVCAGQITLTGAQRAIKANWVHAYHRYVSGAVAPSPSPAPSPAPPPSPMPPSGGSCYPKTSSGNCYEPGEFCPTADQGMQGLAGDGEIIVCANNDGLRWEPA
jgi:hypothetical protein